MAQFTKESLYLAQTKYNVDLSTPTKWMAPNLMHHHWLLTPSSSSTIGDPFFDPIEYRSILGTLQYLSLTELNVAFSMNQTCQFMHTNPPPVIKLRLNLFWGTSKAPLIMTYFFNLNFLKFKPTQMLIRQAIQMIGGQRGDYCVYLDSNTIWLNAKKQPTFISIKHRIETFFLSHHETFFLSHHCWIQKLLFDLYVFLP